VKFRFTDAVNKYRDREDCVIRCVVLGYLDKAPKAYTITGTKVYQVSIEGGSHDQADSRLMDEP
jgi:hypothetical protein